MGAAELVQAIERSRLRVLAAMQHLLDTAQQPSRAFARSFHDVLLAVILFGWLPPLRCSCVVSMTWDGQRCQHRDCPPNSGCPGNRLARNAAGALGIWLPHHKTARSSGTEIAVCPLPAEASELLELYLEHCRPLLAAGSSQGTVFIAALGGRLSPSQFSTYFKRRVLPELGLAQSFNPGLLRHIFIDERLSAEEAAHPVGPRHLDAASVMGNGLVTWDRHHHIGREGAGMQRAVAAMPELRAHLLTLPADA